MGEQFGSGKSKLATACETIVNIINLLDKKDKDQVGIILFENAVSFSSLENWNS